MTEETSRWASPPPVDDGAVHAATGRDWDAWRALIDAWPGHDGGHQVVAEYLAREHDLPGWWAQQVTIGWERITGRRQAGQRADGTFTTSRSRTLAIDAEVLRERLLDERERAASFGDVRTGLRSRMTSKSIRLEMPEGVAVLALAAKPDGRCTVSVEHAGLEDTGSLQRWAAFWGAWLERLS